MSSNQAARNRVRGCSAALVLAVALWLNPAPAGADVRWSWSFGTESGTFVTTGTLAQTAGAGVFAFTRFSVSASQFQSNVGATYIQTFPIQTMAWDGTQPTQFTRNNGNLTNGSNFDRADGAFFYGLGAGPPIGVLLQNPLEIIVVEGALTVTPLSDVPVNAAPVLTPTAAALLVGFLALTGFVSLRRGGTIRVRRGGGHLSR